MHRSLLLQQLIQYQPTSREEYASVNQLTQFVAQHPGCFDRNKPEGHITGSAWLLNHTGDSALLTHHRKLDKWIQLGGHAEGETDVLAVALREVMEESGIDCIAPVTEHIFDVDIHTIPAHGNEPEHLHYDVRFLFQLTEAAEYVVSDESHDLRWVSYAMSRDMDLEASMERLFKKWHHKQYPKPRRY